MITSDSITNLATSLVKAQQAFAPAIKGNTNPAFKSKYVDLATAIDAAQKPLLDNGIAVIQGAQGDVELKSVTVTTRLIHISGEWIEDSLTLPAVNRGDFTAQSAGSAITYARRYGYMALLGFAPEDDDGNGASTNHNGHELQAAQQRTAAAAPSTALAYDEPHLHCTPIGAALRKTKDDREFFAVKLNGMVKGKDTAFCWRAGLFDALKECKGKDCRFVMETKGDYLNIEEVLMVGAKQYRDGNPYNPTQANSEITDDDIPF